MAYLFFFVKRFGNRQQGIVQRASAATTDCSIVVSALTLESRTVDDQLRYRIIKGHLDWARRRH